LDNINKELEYIKAEGIIVFKNSTIRSITSYLKTKIIAEMLKEPHLLRGETTPWNESIQNIVTNALRRRDYRKLNPADDLKTVDAAIDQIFNGMENLFEDPRDFKKFFLDYFEGDTEKYFIRILLESFIPPEKQSKAWFFGKLSGLLLLLIKDPQILKSEEDFFDGKALYGNNYPRFVAMRIQKLMVSGELKLNEPG
jgi:hypothetical protein